MVDLFFHYVPLLIERYDFLVNELEAAEKKECLVRIISILLTGLRCLPTIMLLAPL